MFNDKAVLITGATGSFGRKAVEVLLKNYQPRRLVVLSRDELKQFEMQQQFPESKYPALRYFLGDVRDPERLFDAFHDVDIVIHAAAIKQVPAAEYNPIECIRTNIHGAENVIRAAIRCGVSKVIALSTDKAANPINLYGATKLASDKLFVAANNIAGGRKTKFAVVRYGNVIGSRGSVIPFFKRLLAENVDALPITHQDMTRFWITLEQGVEFVIRSFERMYGGEIFIPKIPSTKIIDLAEAMAPGMPTKIIGIRPGEKLHETMCPSDDSHLTLEFGNHFVIKPTINFTDPRDYLVNAIGETGTPVPLGFDYSSNNNPDRLTGAELLNLIKPYL